MSVDLQKEFLVRNLKELRKLRGESVAMYSRVREEIDRDAREIRTLMQGADMAAMFATLLMRLVQLAGTSFKAAKATTEELKRINRKVARDALNNNSKVTQDVLGLMYKPENAVVDFLLNCTSPSYWAIKFTGIDPEQVYKETRTKLDRTESESLEQLDRFIAETTEKLKFVQGGGDLLSLA